MDRQTEISRLFSPAKVNIGLAITGQRPDGYHELASLFIPIDFGDEIYVRLSSGNRVEMKWHSSAPQKSTLPSVRQNLISKTLAEVSTICGLFWDVRVKKKIPIGGGLGGASSNVGTLLCHLVKNGWLSRKCALEIGEKMGADVPFFLSPHPSWVTGIGERTAPIRMGTNLSKQMALLLLFPPNGCSTAEVFSHYQFKPRVLDFPRFSSAGWIRYLDVARNDLEKTATKLYPALHSMLRNIRNTAPSYCSITGSGSTCIAIYPSHQKCQESLNALTPIIRQEGWKGLTSALWRGGAQPALSSRRTTWRSQKSKFSQSTRTNLRPM